mgnify:CR=1 FL=1
MMVGHGQRSSKLDEFEGGGLENEIRRGLLQLLEKKEIENAKSIALKLMEKGSYQLECSDEGLMQEEIEGCLRPVIAAVSNSSGGREWALEMLQQDRIGVVCQRGLTDLVSPSSGS